MLTNVTAAAAVAFVKQHHYTGSCVPGAIRYGWTVDGELVGVSVLDLGTHATRQGVFGSDHYRHVMHHHRLALHPDLPKFSASQFIGATLRDLRVNHPDVWAIVTYADSCQAHYGTIYQATNATYTGVCARGNLKFLTGDGVIVTTQSLRGTWPERRAEAARRGWAEVRCKGKHRYVYLLGTAKQRRARPPMLWPTLPYPKD